MNRSLKSLLYSNRPLPVNTALRYIEEKAQYNRLLTVKNIDGLDKINRYEYRGDGFVGREVKLWRKEVR